MDTAVLRLLVSVTVCGLLEVETAWFPKDKLAGETPTPATAAFISGGDKSVPTSNKMTSDRTTRIEWLMRGCIDGSRLWTKDSPKRQEPCNFDPLGGKERMEEELEGPTP